MVLFDNKAPQLERMRRVCDLEECKKLAQKHSFYFSNNERPEELDDLWVTEAEHRKTASYGMNWGYYVGIDEIRRYYTESRDRAGDTDFATLHPMSTWAVQVARDGLTAYGIWNVFAYETFRDENGVPSGWWVNENYAMDFAKEAAGWKIWRVFVGNDLFVRAGDDLRTYRSEIAEGEHVPNPKQSQFGRPTVAFEAFSGKYLYQGFPPLPKEHGTWCPEQSCGLEANPNYGKSGGTAL